VPPSEAICGCEFVDAQSSNGVSACVITVTTRVVVLPHCATPLPFIFCA
jgi:hypothetical protein